MKQSFHRLCGLAGFFLIFILSFLYISNVFRNKVGSVDAVHTFYKEKANSIDVIFVGSSHMYRSISPMDIWHEQGISSFVLASPSQKFPISYYLIKDAIRSQKPKVVVLEMYSVAYKKGLRQHGDANIHQCMDPMPLRASKIEFLLDGIPRFTSKEKYKDKFVEFLFPIVRYHDRWKELKKKDFINTKEFYKGSVVTFQCKKEQKPVEITKTMPIPDEAFEYLQKVVALCKEEKVSLLLMETPFTTNSYSKHYENARAIYNTVNTYAGDHHIDYIDFQPITDEVGIKYATDFVDSEHLNYKGMKKMSSYIGRYLEASYDLEDHRGQEAYGKWDVDYKTFQKAIRKMEDDSKKGKTKNESNEE